MKLTLILFLIAVLFFIFEDISKALSLIFEYKYIHVIPFMIGISAFIALKLSNLKSIIFKSYFYAMYRKNKKIIY